jgi:hypothetical protein
MIHCVRFIWCEEDTDGVFIAAGRHIRQEVIETGQEKGGLVAFWRLFISNVSYLNSFRPDSSGFRVIWGCLFPCARAQPYLPTCTHWLNVSTPPCELLSV